MQFATKVAEVAEQAAAKCGGGNDAMVAAVTAAATAAAVSEKNEEMAGCGSLEQRMLTQVTGTLRNRAVEAAVTKIRAVRPNVSRKALFPRKRVLLTSLH